MNGDPEEPRGPLALLRDRSFGPFAVGKLISSCGVWIQSLAGAVLMFDLTGSAVMVGMVSVLQFVPPLLFAMWAGALTDQFDRRKMLIIGRIVTGGAAGVLAVLLVLLGVDGFGGPAMLLGTVFVMGVGLAISNPAMQSLIPGLVPRQDLEQALAINAAAPSIARTIGPMAGAGLLLWGGAGMAFGVAALCDLCFAVLLLFLRPKPQEKPSSRPSVLGGLRHLVRDDRKAGMLVLAVAMMGLGSDPVVTLTPSLAAEMGGGGEVVGLFASAFGLGAVVLTLSLRFMRRVLTLRLVSIGGFWVLAAGLVIVGLSPNVATGLVGFLIAGTGFMMGSVTLNTRIQIRVPNELRGRVMALWGVAFFGSRPFAAFLNGTLADLFGVRSAVLVAAVLTVVSTRLAWVSYRDSPRPPAAG
jgi:MFS family permease